MCVSSEAGRWSLRPVADLSTGTGYELDEVYSGLEAAGVLEKVRGDNEGGVWWGTTIQGNALAMASSGKPISRRTADWLVAELPERARAYKADPGRPMFIDTLRVFGSYLSAEIDPPGDVDIELAFGSRVTDQQALSAYTRASGRLIGTYLDQATWPSRGLFLHLRKRSAHINITVEDITRLTDSFATISSIDGDLRAVPPPTDTLLVRGKKKLEGPDVPADVRGRRVRPMSGTLQA